MTTGEKIRLLRKSLDLTQEQLGNLIGVKKAAINKYETGVVVNLKKSTISSLAAALHVSPIELLSPDEFANQPESNDDSYRIFGENLTTDEHQLVTDYRSLSSRGQKLLLDRCEELKLLHGKDSEDQMAESVQVG